MSSFHLVGTNLGQISIRHATPDDLAWLVGQLRTFSSFYGTKHDLWGTEENCRTGMLNKIENHLVLIADSSVGPVGLVSGWVTPHPFNPSIKLLSESFWWVAEEHRGSRAGLELLNAFVEWGKKNSDWITFALEHHSPVNDRVLLKRGFKLQERNYLMEVL